MILFILYIFFFCSYFLIYIIFLFKLLLFFFFFPFLNFTLNSKKPWREREFTLIVVLSTRYDDFLIYIVHYFFFLYNAHC
jgi:hypothetical protein